jgi:mRNA interferase RelE/StbE
VTDSPYRVEFTRAAERELNRLRADDAARIRRPIFSLAFDPRPAGARPVSGSPFLRLRVGDVRIIYLVIDAQKLVVIERIARRSESTYRRI